MARGTTNTKGWTRKLTRTVPKAVKRAAQREIENQAEITEAAIARRVPVDKGDLKASLHTEPLEGSERVGVAIVEGGTPQTQTHRGKAGDVAIHVEFGTKDSPAQPHFWPTARQRKRPTRNAVNKAIRNAIRDEASR